MEGEKATRPSVAESRNHGAGKLPSIFLNWGQSKCLELVEHKVGLPRRTETQSKFKLL